MAKTKSQADAAAKTAVAPAVQKTAKNPEKVGGPSLAAKTTGTALPPPNGQPSAARAGDLMRSPENGLGGVGRGRMMGGLQRSLGNARISRMMGPAVQTKLKVGKPNDRFEQEADRTADRVMTMPAPQGQEAAVSGDMQAKSHLQCCPACAKKMQRQADEEPAPTPNGDLQMKADEGLCPDCAKKMQRQTAEEGSEEAAPDVQMQAGKAQAATPEVTPETESYINQSKGGGQPMSDSDRAYMEPRFGRDLSGVRLHTGSRAAEAAKGVNAQAFTRGQDIYFGAGQYQPGGAQGQRLLAHELTHTVQQDAPARTKSIQRRKEQEEEKGYDELIFEPTEAELEAPEEGKKVEQVGVVEPDEGTYLWPQTDRDKEALGLLPMNTRLFVDRRVSKSWYSVYVEGHQRDESLPVEKGTHGYVAANRVNTDMPDSGAWLFRITKGGQGALAVAGEVYGSNFKASWGKDYRYLVNVLVAINEAKGRRYIYKENPDDPWYKTKTMKGKKIWVPGLELVDALHGQISSGSISYEVLTTLADFTIGVAAFIVGLLHGALMSIVDLFVGIADLVDLAYQFVKKLINGTLVSSIKSFYNEIKKLSFADIVKMVGEKWNHPSTWTKWKFRGYVIGYIIVEILMLVFSFGAVTAVKWAGKAARFPKLLKYLSELPKVKKLSEAAKFAKGKAANKIRAALKGASALSETHGWAAQALRIPMSILQRLSKADIGKLKKLPQWARERFARLSTKVKLRLLGCKSPCKVDIRKIQEALKLATKAGKKLTSADEVLDVLKKLPAPEGLTGKLKIAKISKKLRQENSALMTAIKKAGLTDTDFAKLADFLTPGDLANPAQAYRTFVRYMTAVVPAKTDNIDELNNIVKAMVKAESGRGAAMKGAMFEQWLALHVPKFAAKNLKRETFSLGRLLPPWSRTADLWDPVEGAIWEMKHQFSKVPDKQVKDYVELIGKKSKDGDIVRSVNYVFPTREAAELNKHLKDTYDFVVYFVDEAGNLVPL